MKEPVKRKITSFGLYKTVDSLILTPENLDDLKQCLQYAKKKKLKIAIKSGGNSFSDVSQNDQLIIELSKLKSLKSFDEENGIVVVEAGIRIGDLLSKIMPLNWILVGLSGSVNDLVGGLASSNTHGKDSWKNGNFSTNILSFKILLSNGDIKEIKREVDSELFNAIIGGLGFFGIIVELTLKLRPIPSYMVYHETKRFQSLESLIDFFYNKDENFEFAHALIDPFFEGKKIGNGVIESAKLIEKQNCSISKFNEFLSNKEKIYHFKPKTFWSIYRKFSSNKLIYRKSLLKTKNPSIIPFSKFQYPHADKPYYNLLFAPSGFIEFQNIFPKKSVLEAFTELILLTKKLDFNPFIFGVKRHKSDPPYLSFANDGMSITINYSLNGLTKKQHEKFSTSILEKILEYDGIIYLSKYSDLPKWSLQKMYPEYKKIIEIKEKIDPENIFCSHATQRLFLN
mgnify:CR=1 FL=1|tara:strand:+ start:452 stop:1816 length:1365 start_codon:yes stop_codon:yes gene_type:complete